MTPRLRPAAAVELAPDDVGYHDTLARILGQAGRLDDAEAGAPPRGRAGT